MIQTLNETEGKTQKNSTEETKYYPSRFTAITTLPDGKIILYNLFTKHSCIVSKNAEMTMCRYFKKDKNYIRGPLDEFGKYLLSNGYLATNSEEEYDEWLLFYNSQRFRNDKLHLILLATEECNCRCIYCSQSFKAGVMKPEVVAGVQKMLKTRIPKLRQFALSWFGGEPLLGWDVMEQIAPAARQLAEKHDVFYSSNITTNGILLTPDRFSKMLAWGITTYQITIDGIQEEHDAKRCLYDGGPTFQTIINNLCGMTEHKEDFNVRLRIHFDRDNVGRYQPFWELLREKLKGDSRIRLGFNAVGKWGGARDAELNICMEDAFDCEFNLRKEAQANNLSVESVVRNFRSGATGATCYASWPSSFVIGTDGKIMKCTVVLDTMDDNVVGQLDEDGNFKINNNILLKWVKPYFLSEASCRKCFYLPVCHGAVCPLSRIRSGKKSCPREKINMNRVLAEMVNEINMDIDSRQHVKMTANNLLAR